ncbi:Hypothetical protein PACV_152 [Pacmanvirus A23]|uniref:Hypothetical protein n=1 Tax=Pacmanvirus A23 TaxID=1932881 RepID=UPI000A0954AA|nr:Hypothetical protein B9W72_gp150 [Pacmanvirus A23]SIP85867.1 Hypothetical protein PACV_152 [Pacmanvirus A23]
MTFQIFNLSTRVNNLKTKIMANEYVIKLLPLLVNFVLWMQDRYIQAINFINYCWLLSVIWGCCVLSTVDTWFYKRSNSTRVLRAVCCETGQDITNEVKYYYMSDPIKSCASMYRWLAKFGCTRTRVDIIYQKQQSVYVCKLDLDNDIELLSGEEIPFGSVKLFEVTGKKLYTFSEVTPNSFDFPTETQHAHSD